MSIYCYVDERTHTAFVAYRNQLGFDNGSGLLTLLMLRELRARRLQPFQARERVTRFAPMANKSPNAPKVSTYLSGTKAAEFEAHAKALGHSLSSAGRELIRREIDEKWLNAALGSPAITP